MANFVFNQAKSRVRGLVDRVNNGDPATARLQLLVVQSTATRATMEDLDNLNALLAVAPEVTNTGYSRVTLTSTDSVTVTVDDSTNRVYADMPDYTFSSVQATTGVGSGWTGAVILYCTATGAADTAKIPLVHLTATATPAGNDIQLQFNSGGWHRSS